MSGPVHSRAIDSETQKEARMRSLCTAVACCSKVVHLKWLWEYGVMQTWVMYGRTKSRAAVAFCAASGHGESGDSKPCTLYPEPYIVPFQVAQRIFRAPLTRASHV